MAVEIALIFVRRVGRLVSNVLVQQVVFGGLGIHFQSGNEVL